MTTKPTLLLCLAAIAGAAVTTDLPEDTVLLEAYSFGSSYHFKRSADWNEFNPGTGLGIGKVVSDHVDLRIVGGTYKDSYGDQARFIMPGVSYLVGKRIDWHASAAFHLGYFMGSGFRGTGFMPMATFGYDRVDLCLTGVPAWATKEDDRGGKVYPETSMLAIFLKFRIAEW